MDFYLRFHRFGRSTFMGHLDWIREIQSILLRTDLKLKYKGEFSPKMKLAFSPPLPMGAESEAEYVYISLLKYTPVKEVVREVSRQLPGGVMLLEVGQDQKDRHTKEMVQYEFVFQNEDAVRVENAMEGLWEGEPSEGESKLFSEVSAQLERAEGMDIVETEDGIMLKIFSPHDERMIFRSGKFIGGLVQLLELKGYPRVYKRAISADIST